MTALGVSCVEGFLFGRIVSSHLCVVPEKRQSFTGTLSSKELFIVIEVARLGHASQADRFNPNGKPDSTRSRNTEGAESKLKARQEQARNDKSRQDMELQRRVKLFLAGRSMPGLRRLDVKVDGGVVVISGAVRTFYEKQLANHCCRRVAGVNRVIDAVNVAYDEVRHEGVA